MVDVARVFKTAWFAKVARKARISDTELGKAIAQVIAGQADDLGGGVYKKRLSGNRYRAIVLTRAGNVWVYEYLFAKQDRANIADDELKAFRALAKAYAQLTAQQIEAMIAENDWTEVCTDADFGKLKDR